MFENSGYRKFWPSLSQATSRLEKTEHEIMKNEEEVTDGEENVKNLTEKALENGFNSAQRSQAASRIGRVRQSEI